MKRFFDNDNENEKENQGKDFFSFFGGQFNEDHFLPEEYMEQTAHIVDLRHITLEYKKHILDKAVQICSSNFWWRFKSHQTKTKEILNTYQKLINSTEM